MPIPVRNANRPMIDIITFADHSRRRIKKYGKDEPFFVMCTKRISMIRFYSNNENFDQSCVFKTGAPSLDQP